MQCSFVLGGQYKHIYIYIYIYKILTQHFGFNCPEDFWSFWSVFTQPFHLGQDVTQGQVLVGVKSVWI